MIGRLFNNMRKERERTQLRELFRPQEERKRQQLEDRLVLHALLETEVPWRNTRRIKCA